MLMPVIRQAYVDYSYTCISLLTFGDSLTRNHCLMFIFTLASYWSIRLGFVVSYNFSLCLCSFFSILYVHFGFFKLSAWWWFVSLPLHLHFHFFSWPLAISQLHLGIHEANNQNRNRSMILRFYNSRTKLLEVLKPANGTEADDSDSISKIKI